MDIDRLEKGFGIELPNHDLVRQALTHGSHLNEYPDAAPGSYERLEFLGDAVLGGLVADYLYHSFPEMPEGELTELRAAVVRASSLAAWARELGLDQMVMLGKGEEAHGARQSERVLASLFEALLGAIYLQHGWRGARRALEGFVPSRVESVVRRQATIDAKSRLQKICQGARQITPVYRVVEITGEAHRPIYTAEVLVDGEVLARGTGPGKRAAEEAAAIEALRGFEGQ